MTVYERIYLLQKTEMYYPAKQQRWDLFCCPPHPSVRGQPRHVCLICQTTGYSQDWNG
jgi:hypothetical protein